MHRTSAHALELLAKRRLNILSAGDIKLVKWWVAHTESIRNFELVCDPPTVPRAVVSCSFDKMVHLWDVFGNPLGKLQQGRTATSSMLPKWSFSSDISGRIQRRQEFALRVLEQLSINKRKQIAIEAKKKSVLHRHHKLRAQRKAELLQRKQQRLEQQQLARQARARRKQLVKMSQSAPAAADAQADSTFLTEPGEPAPE
mmetsp:Transcript_18960/g.37398  ORF Transcript_18960/g.37398 Transcript_18960/m.37398 type:complete len:200 (+) Transcript_18960:522-1121(+)